METEKISGGGSAYTASLSSKYQTKVLNIFTEYKKKLVPRL